jgi:hypothetical protein
MRTRILVRTSMNRKQEPGSGGGLIWRRARDEIADGIEAALRRSLGWIQEICGEPTPDESSCRLKPAAMIAQHSNLTALPAASRYSSSDR